MKRKTKKTMTPEQVLQKQSNAGLVFDDFLEKAEVEEVVATALITMNLIHEQTMRMVVSLLKTLPHCKDDAVVEEAQKVCYDISEILTMQSRFVGPLLTMQACKLIDSERNVQDISAVELGNWIEKNYKSLLLKRNGDVVNGK